MVQAGGFGLPVVAAGFEPARYCALKNGVLRFLPVWGGASARGRKPGSPSAGSGQALHSADSGRDDTKKEQRGNFEWTLSRRIEDDASASP